MFLKRHVVRKDDKEHVYYSLCESLRVSGRRVIQRRVLSLGELNTTQLERWQRSIEVVQQEGERRQYRLFTDREGAAPPDAPDVCEVILSSLAVRHPRQFGACWLGLELWKRLALDRFFEERVDANQADVPWSRVAAVLAINRLCAPGSELAIEERWYPSTALDDLRYRVEVRGDQLRPAEDHAHGRLDEFEVECPPLPDDDVIRVVVHHRVAVLVERGE